MFPTALIGPVPTESTAAQMQVHPWEWGALAILATVLILVDLFGHVRKAHEPTLKEAATWSIFYVLIALAYGLVLLSFHGSTFAGEYYAGYFTEKALSVDNIFVFIIVIASFKVPRKYQQKVLLYGIVIALFLRLIFILLGAALIERFVWIFFVFGFFLLYTAYKQVKEGVEEPGGHDEEDYEPNAVIRFFERHARVTEGFVGQKLVTRRNGQTWMTPLFLCIVAIGMIDLVFAVDSIPAIYGLTKEPYIVFAANVLALLGLRQLFFLVDGLLERLIYLHYGLAVILAFISFKLILHAFHGYDMLLAIPEPTIVVSLSVILTTIIVTVILSLRVTKKRRSAPTAETATGAAESVTGEAGAESGRVEADPAGGVRRDTAAASSPDE